jgi:hypothetical protein
MWRGFLNQCKSFQIFFFWVSSSTFDETGRTSEKKQHMQLLHLFTGATDVIRLFPTPVLVEGTSATH